MPAQRTEKRSGVNFYRRRGAYRVAGAKESRVRYFPDFQLTTTRKKRVAVCFEGERKRFNLGALEIKKGAKMPG